MNNRILSGGALKTENTRLHNWIMKLEKKIFYMTKETEIQTKYIQQLKQLSATTLTLQKTPPEVRKSSHQCCSFCVIADKKYNWVKSKHRVLNTLEVQLKNNQNFSAATSKRQKEREFSFVRNMLKKIDKILRL